MKKVNQRARTYTKRDLVKRVAAARHENLNVSAQWVDQVFTALREIMMSADPDLRIEIRDFGVLEVKPTKSKPKARNPKSGEIIFVPSRLKTHFKPSKLLKCFLSQPLDGKKSQPAPLLTAAAAASAAAAGTRPPGPPEEQPLDGGR